MAFIAARHRTGDVVMILNQGPQSPDEQADHAHTVLGVQPGLQLQPVHEPPVCAQHARWNLVRARMGQAEVMRVQYGWSDLGP